MKILVITEQREGKWNKVSLETLAAAQQIAGHTKVSLSGVVIGEGDGHGEAGEAPVGREQGRVLLEVQEVDREGAQIALPAALDHQEEEVDGEPDVVVPTRPQRRAARSS